MFPPNPAVRARRAVLARAGMVLLACLFSSGCVSSIIANRIIGAPNAHKRPRQLKALEDFQPVLNTDYYSHALRIPVTPDAADIAVGVLEPGNYQLKHEVKLTQDGAKQTLNFEMSFKQRTAPVPALVPKGTLFVLHGVMMNKESMLHWGFYLAEQGYRVVLVDLRGHGQSTGSQITFGAREAVDLGQVLDELQRRDLVTGQIACSAFRMEARSRSIGPHATRASAPSLRSPRLATRRRRSISSGGR